MKKKLLFLLPVAALMLAGCSSGEAPTTSGDPTTVDPTSTPAPTTQAYTPSHAGTEADPLDAKDAYMIASGLAESGSQEKFPTESKYYIKGEVTSFTEDFNADYGNFSFKIGEPDFPFVGYRLKNGSSKEKFASADDLAVGDVVTIYSDIINFHGTMETNDGYIAHILMPAPTGVEVAPQGGATSVVAGGDLQIGYTLTPTHSSANPTYSVTCVPEGCATISDTGLLHGVSAGVATVKVYISDSVQATKEITVNDPTAKLIDTIGKHR